MTQTPDGSAPQHFPDEGQVGFDPESAPDETRHDDGAPVGETPPAPEGVADDSVDESDADLARSEDDILDEMKGTISELTGDLQRLQAEYLNYKRRVDRDRDLVVQTGVQAQGASRRADVQQSLLVQADSARLGVSSVSLDEEMVSLMSYQHAYEAAARYISVVDQTLDALMAMTR